MEISNPLFFCHGLVKGRRAHIRQLRQLFDHYGLTIGSQPGYCFRHFLGHRNFLSRIQSNFCGNFPHPRLTFTFFGHSRIKNDVVFRRENIIFAKEDDSPLPAESTINRVRWDLCSGTGSLIQANNDRSINKCDLLPICPLQGGERGSLPRYNCVVAETINLPVRRAASATRPPGRLPPFNNFHWLLTICRSCNRKSDILRSQNGT